MPKDLVKDPGFFRALSSSVSGTHPPGRLWFSLFRSLLAPRGNAKFSFRSLLRGKTLLHATSKLLSLMVKANYKSLEYDAVNAGVSPRGFDSGSRKLNRIRRFGTEFGIWFERHYVAISRCLRVNFMEIIKPPRARGTLSNPWFRCIQISCSDISLSPREDLIDVNIVVRDDYYPAEYAWFTLNLFQ